MKTELGEVLEKWKFMRQVTLDLLEVIPEEKLGFAVGENMGSIGKQYRHLGDVQLCYSSGLKTGKMSFNNYRRDYSLENSKEKLKEFLQEVDDEMFALVREHADREIDWFGESWMVKEHLEALVEHEILHQGELIVYVRSLGLEFPDSWELWGL